MTIKYQKFKSKKFKLKKEANSWAKEEKGKINPVSKAKIEINFLQGQGQFSYEAIILKRS